MCVWRELSPGKAEDKTDPHPTQGCPDRPGRKQPWTTGMLSSSGRQALFHVTPCMPRGSPDPTPTGLLFSKESQEQSSLAAPGRVIAPGEGVSMK